MVSPWTMEIQITNSLIGRTRWLTNQRIGDLNLHRIKGYTNLALHGFLEVIDLYQHQSSPESMKTMGENKLAGWFWPRSFYTNQRPRREGILQSTFLLFIGLSMSWVRVEQVIIERQQCRAGPKQQRSAVKREDQASNCNNTTSKSQLSLL